MKGKLFGILLWIGFIAISVYAVYPFFMDSLLGIDYVTTIGAYDKAISAKSSTEIDAMWNAAWEYNKKIEQKQKKHAYAYMGADATDEEYESLLAPDGNTVMGSVQVPSVGIDLPIAHGTANEQLDIEAGHIYGTSLPVGGAGSHAVIAGHTGLRNADIFTNLEKVKEGEYFYVSILNKKLAYKITRILVVLPEDEGPYLQVEAGRDLVTLYTCTPYGVNSHRLLIMGERDEEMERKDSVNQSNGIEVSRRDTAALIRCIGFGAIPFVVAIVAWFLVFGGKRKKKKQPDSAADAMPPVPVPEIPPDSADDWFCTMDKR